MKQYVAISVIERTLEAGVAAKDGKNAVPPKIKTIKPGTIFVPKDEDEESFLLRAKAIREYDPEEPVTVPASRAFQTEAEDEEAASAPTKAKTPRAKKTAKTDDGGDDVI